MARAVEKTLRLAGRASIMAGTALWAVGAYAQDPPAAVPPPAPAAAASTGPGDIIVTATRRNERLRDVPMSITALSQETLQRQGITSVTDLVRVVRRVAQVHGRPGLRRDETRGPRGSGRRGGERGGDDGDGQR